jgi:hypothetical protein
MSREIPLTQGKVAIVDDADYEWLNQWKWFCIGKGGQRVARNEPCKTGNRRQQTIYMHRAIMDASTDQIVDHINGDPLDNCRCNLRFATQAENSRNRKRSITNQSSNHKGVNFHKRDKRWCANIGHNGKTIFLGEFNEEIDAAKAYNDAAQKLFGEFARLNDLESTPLTERKINTRHIPQSTYPGVYRKGKRWVAQIGVNHARHYLGTFDTEQEAIDARRKAESVRTPADT